MVVRDRSRVVLRCMRCGGWSGVSNGMSNDIKSDQYFSQIPGV
jgi:hypothetical protein